MAWPGYTPKGPEVTDVLHDLQHAHRSAVVAKAVQTMAGSSHSIELNGFYTRLGRWPGFEPCVMLIFQ